MATIPASSSYVTGWRTRQQGTTWQPSSSTWSATNTSTGMDYAIASNPSGNNKYTLIFKIHTPSGSNINTIDGMTFNIQMYKANNTEGTIYASLRTKVSDLGSGDTATTYRNNSIGSEASSKQGGTSYRKVSFSFTGTMTKDTDYYLVLYTKSNSDMYYCRASDWKKTYGVPTASFVYSEAITHFFWYFDEYQGDNAFNSQTVTNGGNLQLLGALDDQAGPTYKVSYNANGGLSTPPAQNSTSTFYHYWWKDDYGINHAPGSWLYNVTEGSAMYAVYEESRNAVKLADDISRAQGSAKRTVTFNANGGNCSTASLDSTATINYNFAGWKPNNTGTALSAGSDYTPDDDVTMYASWTLTTGNFGAITLPTATRTGYDFKGWSEDASATSGSTGSYVPRGNVTLYAIWTKQNYPITYYANGHGTAPAAQTKTYGTNLTLRSFIAQQEEAGYTITYNGNGSSYTPATQSTKVYYNQTSWNTASNGSGTAYASGATYSKEGSANLYAIWSKTYGSFILPSAVARASTSETGYKVIFNVNGGSCSTTSKTSAKTRHYDFANWQLTLQGSSTPTYGSPGQTVTPTNNMTVKAMWDERVENNSISLPTATRTGYAFKGWAEDANASSGVTGNYYPEKDITLYAIWEANTWPIDYNANGCGTAPVSQTKTYGQTLTLRPFISQQTTTGYTVSFNRNGGTTTPSSLTSTIYHNQTYWNTKADGSGTNYASQGSYTDNKANTMYAIWSTSNGSIKLPNAISRNESTTYGYTVSFNANGGNCDITSLTPTNRITYNFAGWSYNGTTYAAGESFTPTETTTMTANWSTTTILGDITLPTATRAGYTFKGWSTSQTASTGMTGSYIPQDNIVLHAVWEPEGYEITYSDGYGTTVFTQTKLHDETLVLKPFLDNRVSTITTSFSDAPSIDSYRTETQTEWNTKYNGTGRSYASEDNYVDNAATTLYAIWSDSYSSIELPTVIRPDDFENGYTATFDANGGSCSTTNLTAINTISYTLWCWELDGTHTYIPGASYTPVSSHMLTANWGDEVELGSIELPTPTRVGYTFKGWSTDKNADSGIIGRYVPPSDITLYAIWQINNSLVHYNNNGTDTLCSVYYNNNGTPVLCDVYYNDNGVAVRI